MPLLKEHQQRFVRTQLANWAELRYPDLNTCIQQQLMMMHLGNSTPPLQPNQTYKCRVLYSPTQITITFTPYSIREINKLVIRRSDEIAYPFKSEDRSALNALKHELADDTEILIVKNGLLTDSTFSNLALYDGQQWYTPAHPLLQGVHRQKLLEENILKEAAMALADLPKYSRIKLINAMVSWADSWELSTNDIFL